MSHSDLDIDRQIDEQRIAEHESQRTITTKDGATIELFWSNTLQQWCTIPESTYGIEDES
jgi:hypothetical protein